MRTYDSVGFDYTVNVNSTGGTTENWDTVTVDQTLPVGLKFPTTLPTICNDPSSSVSVNRLTLHCVYSPPGGGQTGTALNFSFSASVDGAANGTAIAAVSQGVTSSVTSTSFPVDSAPAHEDTPAFTVSSAPRLDLFKQSPQGALVAGGYNITYQVGLKVPSSSKACALLPPDRAADLRRGLQRRQPQRDVRVLRLAQLRRDGRRHGAGAGHTRNLEFTTIPDDPSGNGNVATASLVLFVPSGDVDPAVNNGQLATVNKVKTLLDGAEQPAARRVRRRRQQHVELQPHHPVRRRGQRQPRHVPQGHQGRQRHARRGGSAYGQLLPSQYTGDDGNGQVQVNQIIVADVSIGNGSNTAPVTTPGACDVWDNTRMHLSLNGPGPAAKRQRPRVAPERQRAGRHDDRVQHRHQPGGRRSERRDALGRAEGLHRLLERHVERRAPGRPDHGHARAHPAADAGRRLGDPGLPAQLPRSSTPRRATRSPTSSAPAWTPPWTTSTYDPVTNATSAAVSESPPNGISVRVQKRASNPSTSYGSPASVVPGTAVQFELKPTVTAVNLGTTPVAHNVVIKDRLPTGLIFDTSAAHAPGGGYTPVVTESGGVQTLTWTIPSLTLSTSPPLLTFWVTTPVTTAGNQVNEAIISATEDVAGRTTFPASPPNPIESHYTTQTVAVQSLGGVQISKQTLQDVVEPLDPLAFRVTYANLTGSTQTNIDMSTSCPRPVTGGRARRRRSTAPRRWTRPPRSMPRPRPRCASPTRRWPRS